MTDLQLHHGLHVCLDVRELCIPALELPRFLPAVYQAHDDAVAGDCFDKLPAAIWTKREDRQDALARRCSSLCCASFSLEWNRVQIARVLLPGAGYVEATGSSAASGMG